MPNAWYSAALSLTILLVSALLTAIYTLRFVIHAYTLPGTAEGRLDGNAAMTAPLVITAAASLILGLAAQPVIRLLTALTAGLS